jgi:hypothetical protein
MRRKATVRRLSSNTQKRRLVPVRFFLEILEDRTVPALVAAYGFGEGAGASVADASGNGNVGAISNATWVAGRVHASNFAQSSDRRGLFPGFRRSSRPACA